MDRTPVDSSNIASIGWAPWDLEVDSPIGELEVSFHHGGIYSYYKVPYTVYKALREADSVGRTFHALVKGKYPFIRQRSRRHLSATMPTISLEPGNC
jgi:hypothetical protein